MTSGGISNLKMKGKFFLAVGFGIALTIIMALVSFWQVNRLDSTYTNILDNTVGRSVSMLEVGRTYDKYRRIAANAVVKGDDSTALNQLENEYNLLKSGMSTAISTYRSKINQDATLESTQKETALHLLDKIQTQLEEQYNPIVADIFTKSKNGDRAGAALALANGAVISDSLNDNINTLINTDEQTMVTASNGASQAAFWADVIMGVLLLVNISLALTMGFILANRVSKRIKAAVTAAEKMANGDFDVAVGSNNTDEIADLMNTLHKLKYTVEALVNDVDSLSVSFAAGDIDARMDTTRYKGKFVSMANGMNATVGGLIDDIQDSMRVVTEFGNGNFQVEIKKLPGKKEQLTHSYQSVQENLQRFSDQIDIIIRGATAGNLDISMDTSHYHGDWAQMAEGINGLLGAVVKPIRQAIEAMNQLSEGNLSAAIQGSYQGEFANMQMAVNHTMTMLSGYMKEVSRILGDMSQYNLTRTIHNDFVGDFKEMRSSINTIASAFNQIIRDIDTAAEHVASGARQISQSSGVLASSTSSQAESVEELTTTVTTISHETDKNAKDADNAVRLALQAKADAESGNEEMKAMLLAMQQINDSSESIADIIQVIDEIAFQTNLLALNAAVEAARAGEHGKGFAIVAEEVRSLAGRSQDAAKETAALIESSVGKANEGLLLAKKTAETFAHIADGTEKTSSIINEVANAFKRQADAIDVINKGVVEISKATQMNSATSEEQASASEELAGQSEVLRSIVDRFKL